MPKRKKVKMDLHELTNVGINYLSLVPRGANRVPFRITKSESDDMINLSDIFLRKKEEVKPAVAAIIVVKGEGHDELVKAISTHYEGADQSELDGATILKIEDYDQEDHHIVKMSESLAVVVHHVAKGLDIYPDSDSFTENVKAGTFLPSVRMASEMMTETIANIVFKEGDRSQTTTSIERVMDDYKGYVAGLLNAMPTEVFKLESDDFLAEVETIKKGMLLNPTEKKPPAESPEAKAAAKAKEQEDAAAEAARLAEEEAANGAEGKGGDTDPDKGTQGAGEGGEGGESTDPNDPAAIAAAAAAAQAEADNAGEGTGGETGAGEGGEAGASTTEPGSTQPDVKDTKAVAGKTRKSQDTDNDALLASIGALFDDKVKAIKDEVATIGGKVSGFEKAIKDLNSKVQKVESIAKKADTAASGTVYTDLSADPEITATRKSEDEGSIWDGALHFKGFETE